MQGSYELRIDLEDFDNGTAFAHYGSFGVGLFSVDPEEDGYPITIADYSGTAGRAAGWGDTPGAISRGSPQAQTPLLGCCWGVLWQQHRLHPCGLRELEDGVRLGICWRSPIVGHHCGAQGSPTGQGLGPRAGSAHQDSPFPLGQVTPS